MALVTSPQLTFGKSGLDISIVYDDTDLSIKLLRWDNRSQKTAVVNVREYDAPLIEAWVYPGMVGEMDFPAGHSVKEVTEFSEQYYWLPDYLTINIMAR